MITKLVARWSCMTWYEVGVVLGAAVLATIIAGAVHIAVS